jgi:hypothetical protein
MKQRAFAQSVKGKQGFQIVPRPFDARVLFRFFDPESDDGLIGESLGVGRKAVNNWRNGKSYLLTVWHADRIAIRMGTHPSLVWGQAWWTASDLEDES